MLHLIENEGYLCPGEPIKMIASRVRKGSYQGQIELVNQAGIRLLWSGGGDK